MARYRTLLLGLIVSLALPSAVRANALDFGFAGGIVAFTSKPGTGMLTDNPAIKLGKTKGKLSTLNFVGSIPGGPHFSAANLGTVLFTTGFALPGATSSLIDYVPGGSIFVKATKPFGAGPNKIKAGTLLFTGWFSGVQSFTIFHQPGGGPRALIGDLDGLIETTYANPHLLALLGLPPVSYGSFQSFEIDVSMGLNGGAVASGTMLVTPEPGTLALMGTGLLSLAGFIRRVRKT
jgi:hypothetical protein